MIHVAIAGRMLFLALSHGLKNTASSRRDAAVRTLLTQRRRSHEHRWRARGELTLARPLSPSVLLPQPLGLRQGIDFGVLPPDPLVAGIMERPVVRAAERHDPLIAGFGAHGAGLGKAYVMGLAGRPAADQAWKRGNEPQVLLIASAPRLGSCWD